MPKSIAKDINSGMGSGRFDGPGSDRLKWTAELHDLFEKAVKQLDGPDRATPKRILNTMRTPGLTIHHVKSHLQKYRDTKLIPESTNRNKFERRSISEIMPNFSATSRAQLNEALKNHKETETGFNDRLEVQRSLKLKIEAQRRYFERITQDFKNRMSIVKSSNKASSPDIEDFDSNPMEFESDSDIGKVQSLEESRAPKRLCMKGNDLLETYMVQSLDSKYYNQKLFCPWSVAA